MDIGATCRSAGMTSGFTTIYRKNRWCQAQTISHATSNTILKCPKRLSHRPLVSAEVNGCRRRFRFFVLETFDDRTLDVDPIEVRGGLLQSHVSGLGEEEVDGKQLDEDPYIVHDVVCANMSARDTFRMSPNFTKTYISI